MINRVVIFLIFPFFCIAQNINTIAGTGAAGFSGDNGPAILATMWNPVGLATDRVGNIYFSESGNHRIRKIDNSGTITSIAGMGGGGYNGDNISAIGALLNSPNGLACDSLGNIYIADFFNNRVRKINTVGIITTIAGTGSAGYSGDNGPATSAQIHYPSDVAVDDSGNIFIADYNNNAIRKISKNGIISTFAGGNGGGYFGDAGLAVLAKLNHPAGVDVDDSGNVYISDFDNHRVRTVNRIGIISTVVGNGIQGDSGNGGAATAAQIGNPSSIVLDKAGNMFISDYWNCTLRKMSSLGIIDPVTVTGACTFSGDGGPAILAEINAPGDIILDSIGNLYLADAGNNRIRKIDTIGVMGIYHPKNDRAEFVVWPNPASDNLTLYSTTELGYIKIYDALGQLVLEAKTKAKEEYIDVSTLQNGIYFVQVKTNQGTITKKTVIQH